MVNQIPVYKWSNEGTRLIAKFIVSLGLLVIFGVILLVILKNNGQSLPVEGPKPTIEQKLSPILTCGVCSQVISSVAGYCQNGNLIPQGKDSCGCQLPPRCIKNNSASPTVFLQNISGKCQAKEKQVFTITQQGKRVVFSGIITEISPCDSFTTFSEIMENAGREKGKTLVVYLQNEGNSKICIECVGVATIRGESGDIPADVTLVKIVLVEKGGEVVLAEKVLIP